MGYGCCVLMGLAHLTNSMFFLYVIALRCCGQTVNCGKHLTSSLVLHFFAAARMRVESILQALCSCTCLWKLQREKHLRITHSMCLSHPRITDTFYLECPFTTFILKPVSALPSPRIGFLVIVRLSFGLSFGATAKKQKVHVLTY